ncbi:MAG: hypothetical protein EZS28_023411 [Streblomastix strix]|uniref:DDE-1 domain-containing protein n=1 Tax=Streblomastix strix TaxID=222440 RepID=A0A5J4VF75_9EUKA|nr:MAG: hypothetical protein EZS28_023411 [Streblomastix strix]
MKRADTPHPSRQKNEQIRKNIKFFLLSSEMRSITDIYSRIIEPLYEFPGRVRIISEIPGDSTQKVYSAAHAHCFGLKWITKGLVGHALLLSESGEQEICVNIRKMIAINNAPGSVKIKEMNDEERHIEQKMAIERPYAMSMYSLGDNFNKFIEPASDSNVYGLLSKNNLTLAQHSRHTTNSNDAGTQSNIQYYFQETYAEDIAKIYRAVAIGDGDEVNLDFDVKYLICKEVGTKRAPATIKDNAPGHISMVITIMADGPSPSPFLILGGILIVPKYLRILIEQAGVKIVANETQQKMKDVTRIFARFLRDRDAHTSRYDLEAVTFLAEERISLLTFSSAITTLFSLLIELQLVNSEDVSESYFVVDDFAAPSRSEGRKTSRKTVSARNLTTELCLDEIKRKRSPQEVQNGNKIRRLNSAESRSQKRFSKQLQKEKIMTLIQLNEKILAMKAVRNAMKQNQVNLQRIGAITHFFQLKKKNNTLWRQAKKMQQFCGRKFHFEINF